MPLDSRRIALGEEVYVAVRLIKSGLAELQEIGGANDFRDPAFMLLSSGLERLMKCVLCFRQLEDVGSLSSLQEIKAYGHDLEKLLDAVVRSCFDEDYCRRPAASDDAAYLVSNEQLLQVLAALSRFAKSARYYNLDVVGGQDPETDSPHQEWDRLELSLLLDRPDLMKMVGSPDDFPAMDEEITRHFVIIFERLTRALTRLFTLGPLGDEARRYLGYVKLFLFLKDEDLGTRTYRQELL